MFNKCCEKRISYFQLICLYNPALSGRRVSSVSDFGDGVLVVVETRKHVEAKQSDFRPALF